MQQFDLIIIGGGLVGASFAHAIAGSGLSILLIDHLPATATYSGELDNRGIALAYTSKKILQTLNLWSGLVDQAHIIDTIHVSEQHHFGFTKLTASSYNLPALGYVVSASSLGKSIVHGLDRLNSITIMRPATVRAMCFDTKSATWSVMVNDCKLQTKLLIAADGVDSMLRKQQNITLQTKDHQQTAIVANIGIRAKHLTTAYERFTANGVLALLPFGEQRVKCVWTVANANLPRLMGLHDSAFLQEVQAAFGMRLGWFTVVSARKAFEINHSYANCILSNSSVLIGNAANALHPVAAQGFNLGLRDAITLAKVLRDAHSKSIAINDPDVLNEYAVLRKNDQHNTRGFTNSLVTLKISRRAGIIAAAFLPWLNKKIITRGMGTCM